MKIPVVALLENIRSLYNVGSIFRSSDGSGIQKIFLCGYTGTPPRKEISKTALGAEISVPWEYAQNAFESVRKLKQEGMTIVALEISKKTHDLFSFQTNWPLCLMVGNEVQGLSKELLSLADIVVSIPMLGIKKSLNVSCAYSIAVYELLQKYRKSMNKTDSFYA